MEIYCVYQQVFFTAHEVIIIIRELLHILYYYVHITIIKYVSTFKSFFCLRNLKRSQLFLFEIKEYELKILKFLR